MRKMFSLSRRRVLSGVFTNLASGWIGAVIILPNSLDLNAIEDQILLILDIGAAIVCLFTAFWFEERRRR